MPEKITELQKIILEILLEEPTIYMNMDKLVDEALKRQNRIKELSDIKVNKNRDAYDIFVNSNLHNPKYQDKYVVFVNEELYDVADNEVELVKRVHNNYGNIDMFVGKVSDKKTIGMIESPEA